VVRLISLRKSPLPEALLTSQKKSPLPVARLISLRKSQLPAVLPVALATRSEKFLLPKPKCGKVFDVENVKDAISSQDNGFFNGKIVVNF
jgi:hypothetical protein